jgi:glycosyltransferase involved in cell wall biosynthesis
MSEKRTIIIYSLMRWDQPMAGASMAIARELSKTNRVFFIDRPFSIKDLFKSYEDFSVRKRLKAILFRRNQFLTVQTGFSNFVVATPGLTIPINFLPPGIIFDFFNAINTWIVKSCIKNMVKKYQIKEYIFINYFNPVMIPTLKISKAQNLMNIYYVVHDIRLSKYMQKHGEKAQEDLLAKTDMVLVSSKHQFKRLFRQSSRMHYFANAVDYSFFENARTKEIPKPYDLLNIGQTKVIMFCGYLSSIRIDYKLLKLVCETYPQYLVVIIGTYEEKDLIYHGLEQIPNLIILGNRRYESMPSYIKCAHVTIIPYLCNELNQSVYPMKLNEYLAMGKPVVSTHFSPDLDSFAEVVYISSSYQEFLNNIEIALHEDSEIRISQRLKLANSNNWSRRADHLNFLIEQFIQHKS